MPDDYSPEAVAARLERRAEYYANLGNEEARLEAVAAARAARESGDSDIARRIEVDFNRGHP